MRPRPAILSLSIALAPFGAPAGEAQLTQSRCADCHFGSFGAGWRWHLAEWDHSAHGRAGVGCERCHGGDPGTFEMFSAHRGMLSRQNPASPIHRSNIPRTCGACHPGQFAAFEKSRHHELLREGSPEAPNCVTCHGEVGAYLLSPQALFAECARCHGAGKAAPRTDFPAEGRVALTSIRAVRASLDQAKKLIRRVKEKDRRALLEAELGEAQVPLAEAVAAAHTFVYDDMEERLQVARQRAELLLEELANPSPSRER